MCDAVPNPSAGTSLQQLRQTLRKMSVSPSSLPKHIQFHKDVDKIEKNARANYGKFADLANVLSTSPRRY